MPRVPDRDAGTLTANPVHAATRAGRRCSGEGPRATLRQRARRVGRCRTRRKRQCRRPRREHRSRPYRAQTSGPRSICGLSEPAFRSLLAPHQTVHTRRAGRSARSARLHGRETASRAMDRPQPAGTHVRAETRAAAPNAERTAPLSAAERAAGQLPGGDGPRRASGTSAKNHPWPIWPRALRAHPAHPDTRRHSGRDRGLRSRCSPIQSENVAIAAALSTAGEQSCWPRMRGRHRALPQRAPPRAEARRTSETERLQIAGLPAPDRRTEGVGARREPYETALAARTEPIARRLPPPPRDPA